ncbi:hypothetical protein BV898_19611 [Hypsibius exemplaris]|uniref:Uncharacterized protein n=1 Tax=Hypsibius exemplaris TaxID=2072580 RepID=A0A9X6NLZ2_HYPEX|nr:hypothetical protein BV898_19611 [Hypsibius exemplaris]
MSLLTIGKTSADLPRTKKATLLTRELKLNTVGLRINLLRRSKVSAIVTDGRRIQIGAIVAQTKLDFTKTSICGFKKLKLDKNLDGSCNKAIKRGMSFGIGETRDPL